MKGTEVSSATRRRDAERTRTRLLEVARAHFSEHGYDGTAVRAVAAEAGVAPNLITRYFGGKHGLFRAATSIELGVPDVLPGPPETLGRRIAAKVVDRWEGAGPGDPLLMMLRSAGTSPKVADALADFFAEQAMGPLVAHLVATLDVSPEQAQARTAGVGALIMGTVMTRYVTRRGPLAEASRGGLQEWLADRLQRLLDEPAPPLVDPSAPL